MADLQHTMGSDFTLSPTGDLAVSTGTQLGQERVLRRMLTTPGQYIWQPDYGAGLPMMIGQPVNDAQIQGIAQAQMQLEAAVSQNPGPTATITSDATGDVWLTLAYVDAETGEPQNLVAPVVG